VPVLIDPGGNVIAGHGRILAAQLLGWTEVPTICIAHLNQTQLKAFMIADNRLSEISVWDERLLAEQLKNLSELDLDFNLEVTGFTMGEIDLYIEGFSPPPEDAADPADARSRAPITRVGDLWLLGRHRVSCGSALERNVYAALMQDALATMIFVDPPFNVPIKAT
jgi:ParB-like chromosome segregation protein Spo0J